MSFMTHLGEILNDKKNFIWGAAASLSRLTLHLLCQQENAMRCLYVYALFIRT